MTEGARARKWFMETYVIPVSKARGKCFVTEQRNDSEKVSRTAERIGRITNMRAISATARKTAAEIDAKGIEGMRAQLHMLDEVSKCTLLHCDGTFLSYSKDGEGESVTVSSRVCLTFGGTFFLKREVPDAVFALKVKEAMEAAGRAATPTEGLDAFAREWERWVRTAPLTAGTTAESLAAESSSMETSEMERLRDILTDLISKRRPEEGQTPNHFREPMMGEMCSRECNLRAMRLE